MKVRAWSAVRRTVGARPMSAWSTSPRLRARRRAAIGTRRRRGDRMPRPGRGVTARAPARRSAPPIRPASRARPRRAGGRSPDRDRTRRDGAHRGGRHRRSAGEARRRAGTTGPPAGRLARPPAARADRAARPTARRAVLPRGPLARSVAATAGCAGSIAAGASKPSAAHSGAAAA